MKIHKLLATSLLLLTTIAAGHNVFADDPIAAMSIDSKGNVGVGTKNPKGKFHVVGENSDATKGEIVVGNTDSSSLRIGNDKDYSWIQSHNARPLKINPIGNNIEIGNSSTDLNVAGNIKTNRYYANYRLDASGNQSLNKEMGSWDVCNLTLFYTKGSNISYCEIQMNQLGPNKAVSFGINEQPTWTLYAVSTPGNETYCTAMCVNFSRLKSGICGNGIKEAGEDCDDGNKNTENPTGKSCTTVNYCSTSCKAQSKYLGSGVC
jgi:hypothetical protein